MIPANLRDTSFACLSACCVIACCSTVALASEERILPPLSASGAENQLGLVFSPDGMTAFWASWDGAWGEPAESRRQILVSRQSDGAWSNPQPAPFSGEWSDDDPFVSPDGQWLYFVSDRPGSAGDKDTDTNIWRYRLAGGEGLEKLTINSEAAEYSPVVTAAGALYFASTRNGDPADGDLYRAAPEGGAFAPPEPLGVAINSPTGEWNLWVSADERELIFEASSRSTNVSNSGDLYYSWRTPAGWTAAVPVNALNSHGSDLMPRMHPDGNTLYYATAEMGGHPVLRSTEWAPLRASLRAAYAPTLLVANRSSHEVSFVNLAEGEVVTQLATGPGPHLLSNVAAGRVLATGYGEFPQPHTEPVASRPPFVEMPNSRITLIDTTARTVLLDTVIEGCANPHASWIVPPLAYVTCESEQRVRALDLSNGRPVRDYPTLQEGSHVLSFEPASRTLAVSNTESGSVTLIDIDTGDSKIVSLRSGSEGSLAVAGNFWIANGTDGSVSVVDRRSATVIKQIDSVCPFPIALTVGQGPNVWLACFGSAELVAIDREDFTVQRRVKLDAAPLNLLMHPARDLVYVSYPRMNAVAEIDLATGAELRRIRTGIEPDGLRWALRPD